MWFIVAISSFFLIAVTAITDKFLLTKSRLVPVSYAFLVGFLGAIASIFLLIWEPNFHYPKEQLFLIILAGAGFYFAIYFMYLAVVKNEISRVNPIINSLVPIFTYSLSIILVVEYLSSLKMIGAAIVIMGSYLLSQAGVKKSRLNLTAIIYIAISSLMFGAHHIFSKIIYSQTSFLNAFVWIRWFILVVALVYVSLSGNWPKIFSGRKKEPEKVAVKTQWSVLIFGQACGAVAILLYQYAIKLGSPTLVTSLQGVQYFFLLLLAIMLTRRFPQLFKEDISAKVIGKKVFYSLILFLGIILILV
ncbi:DMT family transporter [Patescibacteria group bacterium]|nr:DMT family transporter [Patescibacteria group bacterium]